jgi:hypothetical protein
LYLSASAVLETTRLRTVWLIEPGNRASRADSAVIVFTVLTLVLDSLAMEPSPEIEKQFDALESYSGFWNRVRFFWLSRISITGYAKVITVADLPALAVRLGTARLHSELASTWDKYELMVVYTPARYLH